MAIERSSTLQNPSTSQPREYTRYAEASHTSHPRKDCDLILPDLKAIDRPAPAARELVFIIFTLSALPQKRSARGPSEQQC